MHDRRGFLARSSLLTLGGSVPAFLGRTAHAAAPAGAAGSNDRILVVVQLTGGNDGLNTVVPHADPAYAKLRPTLKLAKDQLKTVTEEVGLHPALGGFAKLLEQGALSIVQGVGYPNPDQSHFRSMDIWQSAGTAESPTEGWLGRAMKQKGLPAFHVAEDNEGSPLALAGAPVRAPSLKTLADFQLKTAAAEQRAQKELIKATDQMMAKPGLLDFVRRTAAQTYASSDQLKAVGAAYQPKADYPATGLAQRLKLAAQLIAAGVGARVLYVSQDGYDTHAAQAPAHQRLLEELGGAVGAFCADVAAHGHKDRVLVMTFSEFGRRAAENGSRGTDHGSGAPVFLAGAGLKAGLVGTHPSLTDIPDGNLKHLIDFRRVYAAILGSWLGVDAKAVLGDGFAPLEVLA